jgi:ribosome-binding protein aMBF1 (putative translation factor)
MGTASPSPRGRVALLGIAQRQIRIKYAQKSRNQKQPKPLPASINTLGDLIQVKRTAKNLTPGHLALKMGIATALVRSWEDGTIQPNSQQIETLASLLGFDAGVYPHLSSTCQEQSQPL